MSAERWGASPQRDRPGPDLVEWLAEEFQREHGIDLRDDRIAMARLKESAAKAERELEQSDTVEINLPYLAVDSTGPKNFYRKISREDVTERSPGEVERLSSPQQSPVGQVELPGGRPIVTYSLLILSVLIYLIQVGTRGVFGQDIPAALGVKANQLILEGQYWRLLTPMLLHGSLIHLGFNMYALSILGRRMERFFGPGRFLGLYLISGLAGNLCSFLLTDAPSLGSSTAIFGILGAEGVFIYQHRQLFGDRFQAALRQIILVAGINIMIGLSPGIDNWGHIGGLLGGIAFAWFGGPAFRIEGLSPHRKLVDKRSEGSSLVALFMEAAVLVFLAGLAIMLRNS